MRGGTGLSARAPSSASFTALCAVLALALAGCTGAPEKSAAAQNREGPAGAPRSSGGPAAFAAFPERLLEDRTAMYPRVVRLRDGRIVLTVATSAGEGVTDVARFYESSDEGRSFRPMSEIRDPAAAEGRGGCCGSLLELPRQAGAQPAGTLLWAGTAGMKNHAPGRRPELRVWRSVDGGRSWAYLSSCASAPDGTPWDRGLWEPELTLDGQGRLVCYFADETQPGYDQALAQVASTDGGATWGPKTTVVAPGEHDRPGMPVVRRLPNGSYLMTYEMCGPAGSDSCKVYYRRSADGWTWGDPRDRGTAARTSDGKFLYHAPTIAWAPGGGPDGRLLLVGGLLRDHGGKLSRPASGSTLLVNTENGHGRWYEQPAPVHVTFSSQPDHDEVVCSNYSSSLLPLGNGSGVLEVATKRGSDGRCQAYVSAASLTTTPGEPKDGPYRVRNAHSGLCLDATGPGDALTQLPCDDSRPRQRWTVAPTGDGAQWLRNTRTGRCLGSGECPGGGWLLKRVAGNYYTPTLKADGRCLEVTDGAQSEGAVVRQSACNQRAPQLWRFEPR
ncbi:RICIN domain-containing protein [Actinomadura xylanilytica]|uniref:RICIN domain-containing protein n=1 Tax=Actinomadura xylanilytica TaxID=887459 RepID=UPI00255AD660|nr:RICIN domain-containing protein [Actinomadura xylanilytica]MDL4772830.1 RICIN domain-containing protein [Actinomadura xylanilytica]